MGNPVVHFEVVGKNPQALQTFYKEAFDWQIGDPMPGAGVQYAMAFPQAAGGINGGVGGGREGYAGHATFYVEVPDLESALSKIERLGSDTMMPPDQVPDGPRIALFRDPEGHVVGLVQAGNRARSR
ncbi:MAG: VOC family protein [Candidatus Eremiobacteraeota bacterium]|nr:VOC family protein [Candidatus Eremiobacteraeota bacterium]